MEEIRYMMWIVIYFSLRRLKSTEFCFAFSQWHGLGFSFALFQSVLVRTFTFPMDGMLAFFFSNVVSGRMYKYNIDWWCFLVEIVFQLMSARVFFSQCWLDLFLGQCHLEFFRLMLTDDFFDRCRLWLFFSQYQLGFFALNINRYYFLADVDWGYFFTCWQGFFWLTSIDDFFLLTSTMIIFLANID